MLAIHETDIDLKARIEMLEVERNRLKIEREALQRENIYLQNENVKLVKMAADYQMEALGR